MPVPRTVFEWEMHETTRQTIRAAVLQKWSHEQHGTHAEFQRYRYNVETLIDGSRIFLHRPAWKNKGCDFEVHCDPPIVRSDGKRKPRPAHTDLYAELVAVRNAHSAAGNQLLRAVERVWESEDVRAVCNEFLPLLPTPALRLQAERALKIAKWLFIEQDITDWNTSGRAMLMGGIRHALAEGPQA